LFTLLRQSVSRATLFQLAAELSWLFAAILLLLRLDARSANEHEGIALVALCFAATIVFVNGAFGVYRFGNSVWTGAYFIRIILAPAIGIPLAWLIVQLMPTTAALNDGWWWIVLVVSLGGLLLVRHAVVLPLISNCLPHRILVLGTGPEARLVEASFNAQNRPGMRLVGFFTLEKPQETVVSSARIVSRGGTLEDTVRQLAINEVIVAVRQQRGGVLPLRGLLDCRLAGVQVTDLAGYFERVHGQVPIESLKISWLIYGRGFRSNALRAVIKRAFDLLISSVLIVATAPLMLVAALLIMLESGTPIIYRQERVGYRGRTFTVLKLRSMSADAEKDGRAAWASVNDARVTRVGRLLRRARIDELPQLLNILKGEMSFVGPRPERPEFVAMLTEQIPFYAVRHSVKPGLTGWAQVRYSYGSTVEQSIRKLEYDLFYVKNHTLLLDLVILLETVRVVLLGEGAR
jgi:sugar transferase (PEP-CTERM system associated)